jgi:hypothetical protein
VKVVINEKVEVICEKSFLQEKKGRIMSRKIVLKYGRSQSKLSINYEKNGRVRRSGGGRSGGIEFAKLRP